MNTGPLFWEFGKLKEAGREPNKVSPRDGDK